MNKKQIDSTISILALVYGYLMAVWTNATWSDLPFFIGGAVMASVFFWYLNKEGDRS